MNSQTSHDAVGDACHPGDLPEAKTFFFEDMDSTIALHLIKYIQFSLALETIVWNFK